MSELPMALQQCSIAPYTSTGKTHRLAKDVPLAGFQSVSGDVIRNIDVASMIRNKYGRNKQYCINQKPSKRCKPGKSGRYSARRVECEKSSARSKAKHVFAVVKRQFGFRKIRYRGLREQVAQRN